MPESEEKESAKSLIASHAIKGFGERSFMGDKSNCGRKKRTL